MTRSGLTYKVEAFSVGADDPDLPAGAPWILKRRGSNRIALVFLVDARHKVFSSKLEFIDALLIELAKITANRLAGRGESEVFPSILADYYEAYNS